MTTDVMRSEFDARLRRISAGTGHTKSTIFVGLDESYRYVPRPQVRRKRADSEPGAAGYLLSLILALLLGLVAALLELSARYHLGGDFGRDLSPAYDLGANLGLGLILGCVLTQILRLRGAEHVVLQFIGVALMLCTYHNLVHLAPDAFAAAFAPGWVELVVSQSEANSIIIAGMTFPI